MTSVQLTFDLGDEPDERGVAGASGELVTGLPEMGPEDRMRAELEILGLDVSRHVVDSYAEFLDALGVTRSKDLLHRRSRSELLVAGVKVATQTPPIRSGRRVVFLTLDDGTGPVDATFFEDAQGPYAATVFGSWLLVVRGELRRTGRRGVSLRATGAWELPELHALWRDHGMAAVRERLATVPEGYAGVGAEQPTGQTDGNSPRRSGAGCWCTPAASRCRRTPTSSRPARRSRTSPASCGTAAPGAQDEPPHDVSRPLGWRRHVRPASVAAPIRTGVVLGGRAASVAGPRSAAPTRPGPRSSTSAAAPAASPSGWPSWATGSPSSTPAPTPSPRSTGAPARRRRRPGHRSCRATWPTCPSTWRPTRPTWCCATACSRSSPTRPPRSPRSPRCSAPAALLSLLVAQRHAAVVARAMAGHFQQALATCSTTRPPRPAASGRRFTRDEVAALLAAAGFTLDAVHAVRVFADLVPGSLLDLEPGATAALVELEQAVADAARVPPAGHPAPRLLARHRLLTPRRGSAPSG